MKKIITTALIICSLGAAAQKEKPKDSVVVITLTREQLQALITTIDINVDSKKTSKDIIDFMIKNAVLQPKKEK